MEHQLNYRITDMKRDPTNGFVVYLQFEVGLFEEELSAFHYGQVEYTQGEGQSFIPFDDLTKEVVIEWIKDSLDLEAIQKNLMEEIKAQKAPITVQGMPWATEEV